MNAERALVGAPGGRVVYVLSHGLALRMLRSSGILDGLCEREIPVTLLVPAGSARSVAVAVADLDVQVDEVAAGSPSWAQKNLREYLPYLMNDLSHPSYLRSRHDRRFGGPSPARRAAGRLLELLNRLANWGPARDTMRQLGRQAFALVERHPAVSLPDDTGLVVATSAFLVDEARVLLHARRAGHRTVGHVLSWDNPTVRGALLVPPDAYLAWGELMREEIGSVYGDGDKPVHVCGAPHFGNHLRPIEPGVADAELLAAGLDPSTPYVFWTLSLPVFSASELAIVRELHTRLADVGVQVLVRPHPQALSGRSTANETWQKELTALQEAGIGISWPGLRDSGLEWELDDGDLTRLSALLRRAAVSINSGSTVALEAMLVDTPVVLTLFDMPGSSVLVESAHNVALYPHISKLIAMGGLSVVRDVDELVEATRRAIAHPNCDRAARARTVRIETGPVEEAGKRVADALTAELEKATQSAASPAR